SVKVDRALIAVDRVYRNNVFRYFIQDYDYHYYRGRYGESDEDVDGDDDKEIQVGEVSHSMGDPIARKKIALRNVHNKKAITTVSLEPFIKNHEPGLYRVVLAGKAPLNQQTRWILITDVGIVAKHGGDRPVGLTSPFQHLTARRDRRRRRRHSHARARCAAADAARRQTLGRRQRARIDSRQQRRRRHRIVQDQPAAVRAHGTSSPRRHRRKRRRRLVQL